MEPPIGDYALIGNCRTSALVSRHGSIDWLCIPRPDSASIFGAILDERRGGRLSVRPRGVRATSRRYIEATNVLETTFACAGGTVRITDAMQLCADEDRRRQPLADHELVRRIDCLEGEVEIGIELSPRPDYARRRARLRNHGGLGILVDAGSQTLIVRSDVPLVVAENASGARGRDVLRAGDRRWIALSQTAAGPGVVPMIGEHAEERLQQSVTWWRRWARGCNLPSICPGEVLRSALALKSMVFPPSGAVIAAPTTSLPEKIGGEQNWDYRYCWIRDASLTMRALLNLGVREEAHAFFEWLVYATRLSWPRLRVLYDIHGGRSVKEHSLSSLSGYRGSVPVRVGNGARAQRQLDVYGSLLDAAWQYHEAHGIFGRVSGRMLRGFVETARDSWREPDAGIWEVRSGERHHTLSKAMCWVAMERGLRLARDGVIKTDEGRLMREMDDAREEIRRRGFNESLGAYVSTLDGSQLDASLLLLSIYGFEEPSSDRMLATIDRIYEHLGEGVVIRRYKDGADGPSGGETAFGICGFWGVEALALAGQLERARDAFGQLRDLSNDVGLFSEEIRIEDRQALGNFPQALTHIGFINAACTLDRQASAGATSEREG